MSDSESKPGNTFLKHVTASLLLVLITGSLCCAEEFLVLHNPAHSVTPAAPVRQNVKRPVTVGLNENGDLILRHSEVSVVVAYNPSTDLIEPQERIRMAQRQENPAISGISFKVSFLF